MGSKLFTYTRKRADQSFHRLTPSVYVIPSVYVYPVSFRMFSFICGVLFLQIPVGLEGMLTAKTSRHPCQAYYVTIVYLILSSSMPIKREDEVKPNLILRTNSLWLRYHYGSKNSHTKKDINV